MSLTADFNSSRSFGSWNIWETLGLVIIAFDILMKEIGRRDGCCLLLRALRVMGRKKFSIMTHDKEERYHLPLRHTGSFGEVGPP